jgi:hypothetical protein
LGRAVVLADDGSVAEAGSDETRAATDAGPDLPERASLVTEPMGFSAGRDGRRACRRDDARRVAF